MKSYLKLNIYLNEIKFIKKYKIQNVTFKIKLYNNK